MNKKLIFILTCFTLFACNYEKYKYGFFEGNWVLLNYLDTVQKYRSVAKANHMPMQELFLKRYVDSITFIEQGSAPKTVHFTYKTSNHIILNNERVPNSIALTKNTFKINYYQKNVLLEYVLADERLVDSNTALGIPYASRRVINSLVLGGVYKQMNNDVPVQFYTNGTITGFKAAEYYEVCLDKTCTLNYTGDVVLLKQGDISKYYTWEWHNNTLMLYNLIPTNANTLTKGQKAFEFFKIK